MKKKTIEETAEYLKGYYEGYEQGKLVYILPAKCECIKEHIGNCESPMIYRPEPNRASE